MRIAIIGGTGREGAGLSLRWALAGHAVFIGSRDADKAREKATELAAKLPPATAGLASGSISGGSNEWAVESSELALLSVPFGGHEATLQSLRSQLQGRILIDITVPLVPPKVTEVHVPASGSAALAAQALLGAGVRVVAALHHVSSAHLKEAGKNVDCDVLVCANDEDARAQTVRLVEDLGLRGIDAGSLQNAVALESLTPVLLYIGKKYKVTGVGVRFTGLPDEGAR